MTSRWTPHWMTLQEIADELNVDRNVIYRMRAKGRGPKVIKIGREYRVNRADYEEWIKTLIVDDED